MDEQLQRLSRAIGEIWKAAGIDDPLSEIHFTDPGDSARGRVQRLVTPDGKAMARMYVAPYLTLEQKLRTACHEIAHAAGGYSVPEAACDKAAEQALCWFREPVLDYLRTGAIAWLANCGKAAKDGHILIDWPKSQQARVKAINERHGVDTAHCQEGQKIVHFLEPAAKALGDPWPAEFEKGVRDRLGDVPRWVISTLWRRQRYINWVNQLFASGALALA